MVRIPAEGAGSIPGSGTKIPQTVQCGPHCPLHAPKKREVNYVK